jgi:hypothetical protein
MKERSMLRGLRDSAEVRKIGIADVLPLDDTPF